MALATYDDVNLILRLYEMRREPKMREARDWFVKNAFFETPEQLMTAAPMGSQENAYFRQVTSYWEMVASFITSGVLNQDLFFQSGSELLLVWVRVRNVLPAMRQLFQNPKMMHNLEAAAGAYQAYMGETSFNAFVERLGKPQQQSQKA